MTTGHIRNFVIISHIDHGKSTLADRFLELTGTVEKRKMHEQVLDSMDLERERGITIKMTPVQMYYPLDDAKYELNLIDTPGHVDFAYEVSRALAAVEGAILLVDATKGIQAQTLAHLHEAQRQGLVVIPAINKIDLPSARIEEVEAEVKRVVSAQKVFKISAKEGTGVKDLLLEVVRRVPPPRSSREPYGRALIFDSQYDSYKGVLAYVRVFDGSFRRGDKILFLAQGRPAESLEVGIFKPDPTLAGEIREGSIGYLATGLKEPAVVRVGDTIITAGVKSPTTNYQPLAGYQEPKPIVFASLFPSEGVSVTALQVALSKLKLSDWALTYEPESSEILGRGFRCGFLGSLHLEIVLERLRREFNLEFVATAPSVGYEVRLRSGETKNIYGAPELPEQSLIEEIREPWVRLLIYAPSRYLGASIQLLQSRRGVQRRLDTLAPERVELTYEVPLAEIISDFYDKLKSISSGFASLSYEPVGYRAGDLVRLDILVAGERVEPLGRIVPRERAYDEGHSAVKRLKEVLPRQLFAVALQAAVDGRVVAREDVKALKKDVTAHLYGGDVTRKRKLWEKQKRGKKKLKKMGRVRIPDRVFIEMLRAGRDQ